MSNASDIPVVRLPDEVAMPMVGFGTWPMRGQAAYSAVRRALEVGYRHLDTATMYANEEQVGRAIRDSGLPRDELFVTTKLMPHDAGRAEQVLAASLRALDTDYLDLWLIHSPPRERAGLRAWEVFLAAQQRGQVRAVGVSNYDPDQLDLLAGESGRMPAVNQIPWNPRQHDPSLLAAHRQREVVLEGYSPLKLTRLDEPVLVEVAERHRVSPAQVVLRWHLEHQIPVIPKSADPHRMATNFDLFGFTLSPEEVATIDALSHQAG